MYFSTYFGIISNEVCSVAGIDFAGAKITRINTHFFAFLLFSSQNYGILIDKRSHVENNFMLKDTLLRIEMTHDISYYVRINVRQNDTQSTQTAGLT